MVLESYSNKTKPLLIMLLKSIVWKWNSIGVYPHTSSIARQARLIYKSEGLLAPCHATIRMTLHECCEVAENKPRSHTTWKVASV